MKVAYLAPEIPSLSATFVYNEMLGLEKEGVEITSISIHYPHNLAKEKEVQDLLNKTYFLYKENFFSVIYSNIANLITSPIRFLKAFITAFGDILRIGLNSTTIKLIYQFIQANKVASYLKKNKCEHLHIHFAHVPTQIGMYASTISGVPFTFMSHANDLFERGILLKEKAARSKFAVTISDYNVKFLLENNVQKDKIKIVRCGINTQEYTFTQKNTLNNPPTFGTLGRLVEKKGMDILVKALGKLKYKEIDFKLEIAGDGPLLQEIRNLVKEQKLENNVEFKGALSHDKVCDWMKNLDAFILACKVDSNGDQDGIPVVLMEAMAVGTPVISTFISGIPELIEDKISGFLAEPGNPISLSEKIEELISHQSDVTKLTENAKNRIHQEFDQKVNIDRLIEIFGAKNG